ncbi:hypothetical protein Esi_0135_0013 [Ectocarpus siliculosus]|uniref:Uncharacterized protein n=1 Tax=Ectocarpus siliculosus TaxID=2880 RepID=D7FJM1_ECTSI|nr:hypothetical protein Esi_0135_0013 [Ectocarpus siliculosus]|eukprot:CBJ29123.1 hypothetical protein Esi_0135_0013 [Ectocarpus siliculosus]
MRYVAALATTDGTVEHNAHKRWSPKVALTKENERGNMPMKRATTIGTTVGKRLTATTRWRRNTKRH